MQTFDCTDTVSNSRGSVTFIVKRPSANTPDLANATDLDEASNILSKQDNGKQGARVTSTCTPYAAPLPDKMIQRKCGMICGMRIFERKKLSMCPGQHTLHAYAQGPSQAGPPG